MKTLSLEELMGKPLNRLRQTDVSSPEEEALLQAVVNKKVMTSPLEEDVSRRGIPDIKTPEEEARWQGEVDRRVSELKAKHISASPTQEPAVEPHQEQKIDTGEVEHEEHVETTAKTGPRSVQCQVCGAKTAKHKKTCPLS